MKLRYSYKAIVLLLVLIFPAANTSFASDQSVAREWNEALLFSIRRDFARPTIHARNLFHVSIAMYDAWAVYDSSASTFMLGKIHGGFEIPFNGIVIPDGQAAIDDARHETISYACYRLLKQRFQFSPGALEALAYYDSLMTMYEYPTGFFSQDYSSGSPAALGNYIAAKIIEFGFQDGSNQQGNYSNLFYETVNPQIIVNEPGNPTLVDPNRWQAIFLDEFIDQSGNPISISPPFLSPEWGEVIPFSMDDSHKTVLERDGHEYQVYMDPGQPPYIDTSIYTGIEDPYKWGFLMVSLWQSHLDPTDGVMWDVSPASIGNTPSLPETFEEYPNFYNTFDGGDPSQGWATNPATGLPYELQMVPRGDYARILAEFWADGPDSETPPGHWFTILNYVSDHPDHENRWQGEGELLSNLEWDIRSYFTLAGAMHDAAIAAWSAKGYYDYPRPVSIIRWMADKGQSTDPEAPNYNPAGIPLIPGYVEQVLPGDTLAGDNDENLYKIKLYTWRGHYYIADPETDNAGVGWILAEDWWTYQRPTFVTPPFAGYVSGHSTYSRTAAEVMTLITGDNFFPGGMGEFHAGMNEFLHFEEGPSMDITLQWATYQDASDQCSLSRIWGGIHPPQDDIPGRKIGIELGPLAFNYANGYVTAGVPYVVQAELNELLITGENLSSINLTVEYNEAMDETVAPTIEYLGNGIDGIFDTESFTWLDSKTCEIHLLINDLQTEANDIGVRLTGAKDLDGNSQRIYLKPEYFDIDTKDPIVNISQINYTVINIDLIGNGTVELEVIYDQAMDMNSTPLVEFESPIPVVAVTENLANSSWVNETTFLIEFDVADIEEQCPDVMVNISGAKDVNGNFQTEATLAELIQIDTKRPVLDVLSANVYLINQNTIDGGNDLSIIALFDEAMDLAFEPEISIQGGAGINSILLPLTEGTGWINPYSYKKNFGINYLPLNLDNIDLTIGAAIDFAGNEMAYETISNFLTIQLDATSIGNWPFAADALSLYPNPVKIGQPLALKTGDLKGSIFIEIIDQSGKLVYSKDIEINNLINGSIIIQTSGFSAGMYSARIISDERTEVVRLVVVQ
jgi:hypothetical protein